MIEVELAGDDRRSGSRQGQSIVQRRVRDPRQHAVRPRARLAKAKRNAGAHAVDKPLLGVDFDDPVEQQSRHLSLATGLRQGEQRRRQRPRLTQAEEEEGSVGREFPCRQLAAICRQQEPEAALGGRSRTGDRPGRLPEPIPGRQRVVRVGPEDRRAKVNHGPIGGSLLGAAAPRLRRPPGLLLQFGARGLDLLLRGVELAERLLDVLLRFRRRRLGLGLLEGLYLGQSGAQLGAQRGEIGDRVDDRSAPVDFAADWRTSRVERDRRAEIGVLTGDNLRMQRQGDRYNGMWRRQVVMAYGR